MLYVLEKYWILDFGVLRSWVYFFLSVQIHRQVFEIVQCFKHMV